LLTPLQLGENFAGPKAMAAALAAAHDVELSSHLFPEISAHLLAATPTAHWLEYVDWAAPILQAPLKVVDGSITPSDAAGCGMAWNAEAVARYRVD
jgi:mandelate racemase